MNKINVLELFAGIGAPRKGLTNIGIEANYEAVEIDPHAVVAYNAIHGDNIKVESVVNYEPKEKNIDLLFHGSPCQGFSRAGKNLGIEAHHSGLLWESLRIIEKYRPKRVIWENVKGLLTKKHVETFKFYLAELEELGYTNSHAVLNSFDFGLPQNRERVFVVSTLNGKKLDFNYDKVTSQPLKILQGLPFEKVLKSSTFRSAKSFNFNPVWKREDGTTFKAAERETLKDKPWNGQYTRVWRNPADFGTIPTTMGIRMLIKEDQEYFYYRWLTGLECLVATGFTTEDYIKIVKVDPRDKKIIERAGNSIAVPVLEKIFGELFNAC